MRAERSRVLVVDDDVRFADTLAQSLHNRGWEAGAVYSAAAALRSVREQPWDAAIVDLRIGSEDGLQLISPLRAAAPQMRILVLTGYASIVTAVQAIKLGADDYLAKPVTAAAVAEALQRKDASGSAAAAEPMSPRRLEWEHIQRVLTDHGGNISETARALKMHRRTLQRKLAKRPAPD
jgi:two-component system response regulator RegA